MDVMFWVWLAVIIVTAIVELATMEVASIWFTFGAIIPFILAATNAVRWEIQLVIFVVLSAFMIASLRQVTKKYLLRNSNEKTNKDALVGQKHRMLERTDFETTGRVKINDVVWSAVAKKGETIEKDEIVEILEISGNKLIVKRVEEKSEKEKIETMILKEIEESNQKSDAVDVAEDDVSKTTQEKKNVTTAKKSTANKTKSVAKPATKSATKSATKLTKTADVATKSQAKQDFAQPSQTKVTKQLAQKGEGKSAQTKSKTASVVQTKTSATKNQTKSQSSKTGRAIERKDKKEN